MNPTTISARLSGRTDAGEPRTRRGIGAGLLAAALITASSCGSDSTTQAGISPARTAPTTMAATTAAVTTTTAPVPPPITSVVPTTVSSASVARPTVTIDELVGSEGERVHVRCVGQGDTTVVLIAGFGGDSSQWAKVEPAVAAGARVCSYDRPGTGSSDPATSPATFTALAADLHALLRSIGEPGPYVLVGHSFGGAQAVAFASLFADEVTGLVLVDASPTTWPAALCAVPEDGSGAAAALRGICAGTFPPTGNDEQLDVVAAFTEVAHIISLGSLPMAVVTAIRRELPADLALSEVDRLNEAWNQGQHDWMELSSSAHLVTVDHTGHHIELDQPRVVIDEVIRLLP